jgi:predicted GNAT family acetyltransferase
MALIMRVFRKKKARRQPKLRSISKFQNTSRFLQLGMKNMLLIAACGTMAETPHIEPAATVPEHRGKGLGKAVVYESVNRAKE